MANFFEFMRRSNKEPKVYHGDGSVVTIHSDGDVSYLPGNVTPLSLNDYQDGAAETAIYTDKGLYPALGLAGEAGEVAGKVSKVLRDDGGIFTDEVKTDLKKELGDVLWFVAAMARDLDFTLEEIAQANLDKLASRKARGVLGGSGDNR